MKDFVTVFPFSFSQTLNMIRTVTILAATTLTLGLIEKKSKILQITPLLVSGTPRQCYSCGYKKVNNATETQARRYIKGESKVNSLNSGDR